MGNDIIQHRVAIGVFNCIVSSNKVSCKVCYSRNTGFTHFIWNELCKMFDLFCNEWKACIVCLFLGFLQAQVSADVIMLLLLLLLIAGDVQPNPGPVNRDITHHALSIFHLNTRSIRNKLSFLSEYLSEFKVVCFTETHLDDSIINDELYWDNFHEPIRKDRNMFGGGVMVYVNKMFSFKRIHELENMYDESIWIQLFLPKTSIMLCTIYRPEYNSQHFWTRLDNSIETALDFSCKIIIVGDLNENMLSRKSLNITEILNRKNLQNIISEPTRD